MLDGRVAADPDRVATQVDGVVVPVLQREHVGHGAVADQHGGERGVARRAGVRDHDGRLRVPPDADQQPAPDQVVDRLAVQAQHDRLGDLGVGRDVEQQRAAGGLGGERGRPVVGRELAELHGLLRR